MEAHSEKNWSQKIVLIFKKEFGWANKIFVEWTKYFVGLTKYFVLQ